MNLQNRRNHGRRSETISNLSLDTLGNVSRTFAPRHGGWSDRWSSYFDVCFLLSMTFLGEPFEARHGVLAPQLDSEGRVSTESGVEVCHET